MFIRFRGTRQKISATGASSLINRRRDDAGYTLLELLVVMGILALLTAIATPQLMGYFGKAKVQSAQVQIQSIGTALELYYMENGSYPNQNVGLKALVRPPADAVRWNGPYLKKAENLLDPWGRPYQYNYPTNNGDYAVYSLGPNGKGPSPSGDWARLALPKLEDVTRLKLKARLPLLLDISNWARGNLAACSTKPTSSLTPELR